MSEYKDMFVEEAREHLQTLNQTLVDFEENPKNNDALNQIFRAAHTLKGMAAAMNYEKIQKLSHKTEDTLDLVRNNQLEVSTDLVDLIFDCFDGLEKMVEDIAASDATFGAPPCEQTLAYEGLTFDFCAPGTTPGTLDLIVYFTPQTIAIMHELFVRDAEGYPLIEYSSVGVSQDIPDALRLKAVALYPTPVPAVGECVYISNFYASVLGWDTWLAYLGIGEQSIILYE